LVDLAQQNFTRRTAFITGTQFALNFCGLSFFCLLFDDLSCVKKMDWSVFLLQFDSKVGIKVHG